MWILVNNTYLDCLRILQLLDFNQDLMGKIIKIGKN